MAITAYIENGVARERCQVDPYTIFEPAYAAQFIPAPDDCIAGWTYVNGVFAAPVPPALTQADFANATQVLIDQTAQAKSYADGVACASYVNSSNATWASQATAFVHWRDSVWTVAYTLQAAAIAGTQPMPTSVAAYLATLPAITWPS